MNNHRISLAPQSSASNKKIEVVDNNEALSGDETSVSLLTQYTNLKYRLEQIEKKVDTINTTLNNLFLLNNGDNINRNDNSKFVYAPNNQSFCKNSNYILNNLLKNKNTLFIFILWAFSVLLALFSNQLKFF